MTYPPEIDPSPSIQQDLNTGGGSLGGGQVKVPQDGAPRRPFSPSSTLGAPELTKLQLTKPSCISRFSNLCGQALTCSSIEALVLRIRREEEQLDGSCQPSVQSIATRAVASALSAHPGELLTVGVPDSTAHGRPEIPGPPRLPVAVRGQLFPSPERIPERKASPTGIVAAGSRARRGPVTSSGHRASVRERRIS